MKTFQDMDDREWKIELTLGSVKRVRDLLDVNLLEIEKGDPPLITRLTDVILLCDVIFVLVKPQADERGITDEAFGNRLGGDGMLAAQQAFYEELIDFFRQVGRADRATAVTKQGDLIRIVVERSEEKIGALNLEGLLAEHGSSSTKLPEPSDSPKPISTN